MKEFRPDRREFIRLMLSVSAALSVGLKPVDLLAQAEKQGLSSLDSLKKLIYILGPWTGAKSKKARDFAGRFIRHASGPYLPKSDGLIRSLAGRFTSGAIAHDSIELQGLPPAERKLLMQLVGQLYTLVEVRFDASGEPPWGQCQTDRLRYTRPPK